MRLILLGGYFFGKNMEKRPFFRAAMAGLGKYHMGGYGRIGVYRVKIRDDETILRIHLVEHDSYLHAPCVSAILFTLYKCI